jgi:hypothetical protein
VTRCQVRESGGAVTIVIPGPKHRLASGLAVIIPVVILVIVIPAMLRFFSRSATPAGVQAVFLIFTVLMFVVPSIIASVNLMAGGRRKTVVTASPAGLLIEKQGPWRNATKRVSADDILDLDYSTFEGRLAAARKSSPMPAAGGVTEQIFASLKEWVPTKGIIVKSRQELITFGEGLPAEELHYIKAILRKVLGGRVT